MTVDFDFTGALAIARELDDLAGRIGPWMWAHNLPRNRALAAWLGPLGDQVKAVRDAHNRSFEGMVGDLRRDSDEWLERWRSAVDDYNDEQFRDAELLQIVHNRARREQAQEQLDEFQAAGTDAFVPPPAFVQKWLYGTAPMPEEPAPALLPVNFRPARPSFANYHLSDDTYVLTYTGSPAGSSTFW